MAHWLDDVAVSVADGTPRRSMLRKLGAGLLGAVAVMAAGSGTAAAKNDKDKDKNGSLCPPGFTECAGLCRATAIDPDNCGACGRACAAGQACRGGQCVSPVCDPTCCPAGFTLQNGVCRPSVTCSAPLQPCGPGVCCAPGAPCGVVCPTGTACSPQGQCAPSGGGSTTCATSADCGPCGSCSQGVCVPAASGTVCRPAAGPCDVAEVCNGISMQCPVDAFRPASIICRQSNDECNPAEFCTGTSAQCPNDATLPNGTPCVGGTCQNGMCVRTGCPAGTLQCGATCCPTAPNQITVCGAGDVCVYMCDPGYANCDGNYSTGCETSLSTLANCGSCGSVCTAPANASAQCMSGQCMYSCNSGYQHCADGRCISITQSCT